jgi:hypothetical protein
MCPTVGVYIAASFTRLERTVSADQLNRGINSVGRELAGFERAKQLVVRLVEESASDGR